MPDSLSPDAQEFLRMFNVVMNDHILVIYRVEIYVCELKFDMFKAGRLARTVAEISVEFELDLERDTRRHSKPYNRIVCPECGSPNCPEAHGLMPISVHLHVIPPKTPPEA